MALAFYVRTAGDPNQAAGLLRREVRAIDPNIAVFDLLPLSEVITANGGDPAAVETAAIATATKRLDQVRTNGNLTQDQENAMIGGLKAFYDAVLNGNFRPQAQPQATGSAPI